MRKNKLLLLLLLFISLFALAACSQGEQGLQGEKGPTGDKGITGDTGAPGDTGPAGQNSKAPEFMMDEEGLKWRLEGETEWKLLMSLENLLNYSKRFTVSFNTNGGDTVYSLTSLPWNKDVLLPTATKEGYTFIGWQSLEENAEVGDVYENNIYPTITKDVELEAVWGSTVSFPEETGLQTVILNKGESTTLTALNAKDNKAFLGWTADGKTLVTAGTQITPNGNVEYTPVYEYTLTYALNGGVGETSETVTSSTLGALPTPTKAGFKFDGWYEDEACTIKVTAKPITATTLYAKWADAPLATVVINNSFTGGSYVPDDPKYATPTYMNNALKCNFVNMGVLSDQFEAQNEVKVTLEVASLEKISKTANAEVSALTFYALNANGEVVATVTLDEVVAGNNVVTLTAEGIVQVKVLMTDYVVVESNTYYITISKLIVRL